jgi:hypothetical protein
MDYHIEVITLGDRQADLEAHGGLDKAVYAYSAEDQRWWEREAHDSDRAHKSMTTSPTGCEQQTRRLPSAGLSSGSGP